MANEYSVTLLGGPPWGFRLGESGCQERPVRVSRLSSGGKAWQQGVQEGDVLLTVAGKNVQSLPHAHQMVKEAAGGVLPLTLVREEPSQEEKMYKSFTSIEVNRSPTGDPPTWGSSSSSSSSSTGSCSTTIVVNSSPRRLLPAPPLPPPASHTPNSPSSSRVKDTTGKRKALVDGCSSCSSSPEPTSRTSVPSPTPSGSPYPPLNVKVSSSSRRASTGSLGPTFKATAPNPVWSPVGQTQQEQQQQQQQQQHQQQGPSSPGNGPQESQNVSGDPSGSSASPSENKENMSPVWQPFGGGPDDKPRFRSVKPASPATQRKDPSSKPLVCSGNSTGCSTEKEDQGGGGGGPLSPGGTSRIGVSSGLLQYQNPTITLLQKAREGQLPKGAIYIHQNSKDDEVPSDAILIDQRVTIDGDQVHTDSYYALPRQEVVGTGNTRVIKAPAKISGIGPTEKGIPVTLRSGVKEEYASDWYKSMYKSLHKSDKPEDYVSVKYGKKAGRMPHHGGYMSEPEFERDDDQYPLRYGTLDSRRKVPPQGTYSTDGTSYNKDSKASFYLPSHICAEVYKNQPRSIAEYEPGRSSIAEREARREDSGDSDQHTSKYLPPMDMPRPSYIDGYESDSTLIRKTGNRLRPLDPVQQKAWYREVQRGGDIPFSGLGKPAPERPKLATVGPPPPPLPNYSEDELLSNLARDQVSPHRYQEGEVNIHYRTPIRNLEKEFIEEETLRKRQEARMRKFYEEERYKKQLQQMHEIEMRRHNDFFTPSQKSPIPLNRYDNPFEQPESPPPKTPEPKLIARALFNFQAQSSRELSLKKGDIVYVTKKIDRNWYEGEHHGLYGIFPVNYVEIIPMETAGLQPRKSTEGQAKAKFNFRSQTPVELSLFKGELVILTRRVDQNWFEGRIGNKKGIFPASYVDVLTEPTDSGLVHCKRSPKLNGHHRVNTPYRSREAFSSYPATSLSTSRSDTTSMSSQDDKKQPITETLHVDTYSEPIPYKVLYGYRPQNDDELELREGDTVYVMEKCDDGWYVGTSLRTGLFGTFPGNYVERI